MFAFRWHLTTYYLLLLRNGLPRASHRLTVFNIAVVIVSVAYVDLVTACGKEGSDFSHQSKQWGSEIRGSHHSYCFLRPRICTATVCARSLWASRGIAALSMRERGMELNRLLEYSIDCEFVVILILTVNRSLVS